MDTNESLRDRQEYLFLVTDNLLNQREVWANDASTQGLPVGGMLWMAAEQLVAAFEAGTIPGSCRKLSTAVDEFSRYWKEHTARAEVSPTDDLLPGGNVWSAITSIAASRKGAMPRQVKRIEPVADLALQKVSDEQIAKIYGWKNSLGQWDLEKVRRAKAEPGKYDGESYYEGKEREGEARDRIQRQKAEAMSRQIASKKSTAPEPGPEPIEMLVAQGLSVAQIARAKVMSVEEVQEYCRRNGVALDGVAPVQQPVTPQQNLPPSPAGGIQPDAPIHEPTSDNFSDFNADDDAIQERLGGDLGDREDFNPPEGSSLSAEEQILNAANNEPDAKPGDIAKLLGVSSQKVTAVLKRRNEIEQVA